MQKCIHILVSGLVQGVYFRANTRQRALELQVRGLVRNLRDARLEIVARGSEYSLERFVEWCRQGPEHARVDTLEIEDWQGPCDFETFSIDYSDR
ncbi:MAG: acylphosphatase [Methylococcales bacterium]